MSAIDTAKEIDSPFLWRTAVISFLWLGLFVVAAILLWFFRDPIRQLFFG